MKVAKLKEYYNSIHRGMTTNNVTSAVRPQQTSTLGFCSQRRTTHAAERTKE